MENADALSIYYRKVAGMIENARKEKGYSQTRLAEECTRRYGISFSQSTVAKITQIASGEQAKRISLEYITAICEVLDLDLNTALSFSSEAAPSASSDGKAFFTDMRDETDILTLAANPKCSLFFGYIGYDYDVFFLPTSTKETARNPALNRGTMTLSNEGNAYCKVRLTLNTEKKPLKEYEGQMVISQPMDACYCVLQSARLGEMCSLVFHHRRFSQSRLMIRMATVATVSAGEAHRPTMHRMVICQPGLVETPEDEALIATQLRLNGSSIMISAEKYNELRRDESLRALLDALEVRSPSPEPYYLIEERDVMGLRGMDERKRIELLGQLRASSTSKPYNKIGDLADALLLRYFR